MKSNVGGLDKVLRIVLGVALIALAFFGVVGVWGYVGIIILATGIFNFCGLYTLLGINTCKLK
ncbi:MAG: hypothetical protein CMG93_14100 [Marinomonas sp.]|uniref:DUF2892 domain-containing protein n=1 Tax=Marinomonas ostreistagni TaxID=359209 RepID=A0ABS0ZBX5_9GAMM|nr:MULTISPECIES: DUF2892 domain-containing protein [Marinomonas]MAF17086.1 hypothetical protein [Marinomonas sp.]MBJ7551135.1 DUF2892 domain-containing protein [Marinomonas ostreistagni]MCC4274381.1 DUF2892 domain-containing protein [Marinomonas communis]RUM49002.1 MAG: DUF2892 domain-containing protein [Marinomonas sp.]|tara:strand:- start:1252 stop:1440 length:189 start_codon:yes stop_codon:yes gene_type:complete